MGKTFPSAAQPSVTNVSRNTLPRNEGAPFEQAEHEGLFFGDLRLDKSRQLLRVADQTVRLTGRETNVLELFMQHPEQVLTRQQIYNQLWDRAEWSSSNTIDVHIKNLRKKIKKLSPKVYLHTVRGAGYCLSPRPVNY